MNTTVDQQALDLRRIIAINENIKEVLNISANSHLVAINSMLIAKASGDRLLGFGVVSTELRVFSGKLDKAMTGLASITFDLVRHASQYQKMNRERGLLTRTMTRNRQAEKLLDGTLFRKEKALDSLVASFEQNTEQLTLHLGRSIQLCKAGNALARCAKIEAAYGGERNKVLTQVAEQIEGTVQQILNTLNQLKTAMENPV